MARNRFGNQAYCCDRDNNDVIMPFARHGLRDLPGWWHGSDILEVGGGQTDVV